MSQSIILILVTCAISVLAWQNKRIMNTLIFTPTKVAKGEYWRLITHGFLHGDGGHLLFNMITLYFFGNFVERYYTLRFGIFGFIAFYLLAVLFAALPSYLAHKHNRHYHSLGASGGVVAILFAFILFAPWDMLYFFGILPIPAIVFAFLYVGYSLLANKRGYQHQVNHSAHLAGAGFGMLATLLTDPIAIATIFMQKLLAPIL